MRTAHRTTIRTTCPRDCYDACGMKVVIEDGRVRKVGGDRDHMVSRGKLCPKCALAYNGAWIDPTQRITRPLRRAGAKGAGMLAVWANLDGMSYPRDVTPPDFTIAALAELPPLVLTLGG